MENRDLDAVYLLAETRLGENGLDIGAAFLRDDCGDGLGEDRGLDTAAEALCEGQGSCLCRCSALRYGLGKRAGAGSRTCAS